MKKYCIYKIINNKNKDVLYVGCHLCSYPDDNYYGSGAYITYFKRRLKRVWKNYIHKEIICYGIEDQEDAFFFESFYIQKYKEKGQAILNYQLGGYLKKGKPTKPAKREKQEIIKKIDNYIFNNVV